MINITGILHTHFVNKYIYSLSTSVEETVWLVNLCKCLDRDLLNLVSKKYTARTCQLSLILVVHHAKLTEIQFYRVNRRLLLTKTYFK